MQLFISCTVDGFFFPTETNIRVGFHRIQILHKSGKMYNAQ